MRYLFTLLVTLSVYANSLLGASLDDLVDIAMCNNPEIKAAEERLDSAKASRKQQYGSFHPQVSFESGKAFEDLNVRNENYEYGYLQTKWNLYHGGRDRASIRIGSSEQKVSQASLCQLRNNIAYQVSWIYYDLLYLNRALQLFDNTINASKSYCEIAQRKFEKGITSEVDLIEFELQEESLTAARRSLETTRQQQLNNLHLLLGCIPEDINLDLAGDFITPDEIEDVCDLYERALSQRYNRSIAAERLKILREEYNQACGEQLPSLDLLSTYGKEPDILADRGLGTKVYLHLSIPLYSGFTKHHKKTAAKKKIDAQCHMNQNLDNEILVEIQAVLATLDMQQKHLKAEQAIAEKNEKYWTMTKEEYQKGVKNSPDLASASDRSLQSNVRILALKRDISQAMLDIALATGDSFTGM